MDVTVYTAFWCPDCREAKRFLAKHQIPFKEIDIEVTPGAADEVMKQTGKRAIPQFVTSRAQFNHPAVLPDEQRHVQAAMFCPQLPGHALHGLLRSSNKKRLLAPSLWWRSAHCLVHLRNNTLSSSIDCVEEFAISRAGDTRLSQMIQRSARGR